MNNENPSKISKIFQKLDELKQPKKSNLVAHNPSQLGNKIQRKKTITINLPEKTKENNNISSNNINKINNNINNYNNIILNQSKEEDSNKELLTINVAAKNVKNLLVGFLENATEDDKKVFNIEEQLKTIKKSKFKDKLNIYSIIGKEGEDSDESNKELLNQKKPKIKRVMTTKSKFNIYNKNFNKKRRSENLLFEENNYMKFKSKKSLRPSFDEGAIKKRKSDIIDINKRFSLKPDSNLNNRKSFAIENEKKKSINSIMFDKFADFFDKKSSKKSSKNSSKLDFENNDILQRKSLKVQNELITNMLKKHSILLSLEDDDNVIKKTKTSNLKKLLNKENNNNNDNFMLGLKNRFKAFGDFKTNRSFSPKKNMNSKINNNSHHSSLNNIYNNIVKTKKSSDKLIQIPINDNINNDNFSDKENNNIFEKNNNNNLEKNNINNSNDSPTIKETISYANIPNNSSNIKSSFKAGNNKNANVGFNINVLKVSNNLKELEKIQESKTLRSVKSIKSVKSSKSMKTNSQKDTEIRKKKKKHKTTIIHSSNKKNILQSQLKKVVTSVEPKLKNQLFKDSNISDNEFKRKRTRLNTKTSKMSDYNYQATKILKNLEPPCKEDILNNLKNTILQSFVDINEKNNNLYKKELDLLNSTTREKKENEDKIKNDETDIRNYIPLSKERYKQFNNICQNIKAKFVSSSDDVKKNESIIKLKTMATKDRDEFKINNEDKNSSILEETIEEEKLLYIKEFQYRRLIKQNKNVYDSFSDEESIEEIEGEIYIKPNNRIKIIFDMFVLFFAIYNAIYSPYVFAYYSFTHIKLNSFYAILEFIIDIVWIIDLFLGFFTAYYNFDEVLITNNLLIFINYLTNGFAIDLISGFPFNSIFLILNNKKYKDKIIYTYIGEKSKVYELLKFLRLLKIVNIYEKNTFILQIVDYLSVLDFSDKFLRVFFFLFLFVLWIHVLACLFIFIAQLNINNWIAKSGFQLKSNKYEIYITSFYYMCESTFGVGYGDIVSVNIYERFFNLLLLIFGLAIYSYAISSLTNYIQNVDPKTEEYYKKKSILEQMRVTHSQMPVKLYNKIEQFLLYKLENEKKNKNDIIDILPNGLKNTLIREMYKDVINNFVFFKNFYNSDFILKVILAFKPIQADFGEKLLNEGDYVEEIFFVKRGRLALEIPLPVVINNQTLQKMGTLQNSQTFKFGNNKQMTMRRRSVISTIKMNNQVQTELDLNECNSFEKELKKIRDEIHNSQQQYIKIIEIRRNEYFGDILMFNNKRSPLSVKVKSKIAELFILKKVDVIHISMNFPKIWRKIIKKSLFNMQQIERLINKTLKFFYIHNEGDKLKKNGTISQNYFRRDPTKTNKLVSNQNFMVNLDDEGNELQSIPNKSEQSSDSTIKEEENEEFSETNIINNNENENNNSSKNSNSSSSSSFSSSNKSEEENSKSKSKFKSTIKEENSKYGTLTTIKDSININSKNNQINLKYSSLDINNNPNNTNLLKSEQGNKTIENTSIISETNSNISSNKGIIERQKTKKTNIMNEDITSILSENSMNKKNNKLSLISSNSSNYYCNNEINNEKLPFENSFVFNDNNDLHKNIIPIDGFNTMNSGIIIRFDSSSKNNSNSQRNNLNFLPNINNVNSTKKKIKIQKNSFNNLEENNICTFSFNMNNNNSNNNNDNDNNNNNNNNEKKNNNNNNENNKNNNENSKIKSRRNKNSYSSVNLNKFNFTINNDSNRNNNNKNNNEYNKNTTINNGIKISETFSKLNTLNNELKTQKSIKNITSKFNPNRGNTLLKIKSLRSPTIEKRRISNIMFGSNFQRTPTIKKSITIQNILDEKFSLDNKLSNKPTVFSNNQNNNSEFNNKKSPELKKKSTDLGFENKEKSVNTLDEIFQNIEKNYDNLYNPDNFYISFIANMMNKVDIKNYNSDIIDKLKNMKNLIINHNLNQAMNRKNNEIDNNLLNLKKRKEETLKKFDLDVNNN